MYTDKLKNIVLINWNFIISADCFTDIIILVKFRKGSTYGLSH